MSKANVNAFAVLAVDDDNQDIESQTSAEAPIQGEEAPVKSKSKRSRRKKKKGRRPVAHASETGPALRQQATKGLYHLPREIMDSIAVVRKLLMDNARKLEENDRRIEENTRQFEEISSKISEQADVMKQQQTQMWATLERHSMSIDALNRRAVWFEDLDRPIRPPRPPFRQYSAQKPQNCY